MHKNNNKLRYSIRKYENLSCLQLNIGIHKRRIYLLKGSNKLYQSTLIVAFKSRVESDRHHVDLGQLDKYLREGHQDDQQAAVHCKYIFRSITIFE